MKKTLVTKAVIPVAGFGTRFLPATKAQPKEMLPLIDKPVIQFIVEELVASGIKEIVLITNGDKRAIEDHFDVSFELESRLKKDGKTKYLREVRRIANLAKFVYVRQSEQLGTGHALMMAEEVIGSDPFVYCYGDDVFDARIPATKQLLKKFYQHNKTIVGVTEVPREMVNRFGVIDPKEISNGFYRVMGSVEKPEPGTEPSNLISSGRFVFTPKIFHALHQIKPGKHGELWAWDAVEYLRKREPVYAVRMNAVYYNCGNKLEFLKAQVREGVKHSEVREGFKNFLKEFVPSL